MIQTNTHTYTHIHR